MYKYKNRLFFIRITTFLVFSFIFLSLNTSCDSESNAQSNEVDFSENYSGSFLVAPASTDSNDDGRPANSGNFSGTSTFGNISIQSLNEFEIVLENSNCLPEQIEFALVRGNFVKRFSGGELVYGTWNSGVSCFDPLTNISTTTQFGNFSGGTGQFTNASGSVQIDYTSNFLAVPTIDGFSFGGTTGTGLGTIIFNAE